MRVRNILGEKGHEVVTVSPDSTVGDAVQTLERERIGAVVVSDDVAHVDGIVSETDIVRALAREGAGLLDQPVSTLTGGRPMFCSPDDEVRDVMAEMTRRRTRYLVAIADGRLAGIVSIGDVVKHELEDRELELRVLRDINLAHG
jgi:CBS domain-containing protein